MYSPLNLVSCFLQTNTRISNNNNNAKKESTDKADKEGATGDRENRGQGKKQAQTAPKRAIL